MAELWGCGWTAELVPVLRAILKRSALRRRYKALDGQILGRWYRL